MPTSLVIWSLAALLLFWSIGAYNRLVRLRSGAIEAFAALETQLGKHVELVRECLPSEHAMDAHTQPGDLTDDIAALWIVRRGAARQFSASLAAARAKPLENGAIAALAAAREVLFMAWQRACETQDLGGSSVPDTLRTQWEHLVLQTTGVLDSFNLAVERYNDAIKQFPASVMASMYGFKPAGKV